MNSLTCLYVLTSNEEDFYLEQAMLSITSLRIHHNNGAHVMVLVDDTTAKTLVGKRAAIYNIAEVKAIRLPVELDKEQRSRWLKTSMRQHIVGDFLYIDCDTVIAGDLSMIESINADLAAVADQHCILENHPLKKRFNNLDRDLGFSSSFVMNVFFNGGLLFSRDTQYSQNFFNEWHKLWTFSLLKGIVVDMPSLNQAHINLNNCIIEIDGIWNCQIEYNGIQYLTHSKIIHYFSSNKQEKSYLLANSFVFEAIKQTGTIPQEIKDKLEDPRALFSPHVRLISDRKMLTIINSSLFDLLLRRAFDKNNKSRLLSFLDSIITGIRSFHRNLHDIKNKKCI
jgi:hypothetical protein